MPNFKDVFNSAFLSTRSELLLKAIVDHAQNSEISTEKNLNSVCIYPLNFSFLRKV